LAILPLLPPPPLKTPLRHAQPHAGPNTLGAFFRNASGDLLALGTLAKPDTVNAPDDFCMYPGPLIG
jgi:hypothetical protein